METGPPPFIQGVQKNRTLLVGLVQHEMDIYVNPLYCSLSEQRFYAFTVISTFGRVSLKYPFRTLEGLIQKHESSILKTLGFRVKTNFGSRV